METVKWSGQVTRDNNLRFCFELLVEVKRDILQSTNKILNSGDIYYIGPIALFVLI